MLTLTPSAQAKMKEVLAAQENGDRLGVRIKITGQTCHGFAYSILIEFGERHQDTVLDLEGLKVYIDYLSMPHLQNATIDYVEIDGQSGFKFDNPDEPKGGCGGCPHSGGCH
jgi:iron-sulfur cluster assembly protein